MDMHSKSKWLQDLLETFTAAHSDHQVAAESHLKWLVSKPYFQLHSCGVDAGNCQRGAERKQASKSRPRHLQDGQR
jgi:hypothetical protein